MDTKTEEYNSNVQDLMSIIPTAMVAKHVFYLKDDDGTILDQSTRWVVNDYAIYSGSRGVYSIVPNFEEAFEFFLKAKDYKKFEAACAARRKELFGKGPNKKTK